MKKLAFGEIDKHPDSVRNLTLDFFSAVASFWKPGKEYAASAYVRPSVFTGFAYQADGSGGQSGYDEPAWPTTLSGTVVDGDITWTAVDAGGNGVTALSSPVFTISPSGELSSSGETIVDGQGTSSAAQCNLSGGVLGKSYTVECQVTAGSETLVGSLRVNCRQR